MINDYRLPFTENENYAAELQLLAVEKTKTKTKTFILVKR